MAETEPRSGSGDDANAEVLLELLQENKGENCMGNQADPGWDKTLQQNPRFLISTR